MRTRIGLLLMMICLGCPLQLTAGTLWRDDFNSDTSNAYKVFEFTPGRDRAIFSFDYSSVGIPEAPNSIGGGTRGVQFFVNDPFEDTTNRTSAIQIVPSGLGKGVQDQDFTITYDLWMNVNGPLPAGGGGSTEAMMVGVGFSGKSAPIEAGNEVGTYFTLTGEAGVMTDVRTFSNEGFNATDADGNMINVASVSLEDPYYLDIFPGGIDVGALPVQGGQDNQTGVTRPGQMAFQWHEVRVDVRGTEVSFFVDDLLIARDTEAAINGNIFLGHADYFASETDVPAWNFSVVDNLLVVTTAIGDFDNNGELDFVDIDLLSAEARAGTNNPDFDVTGDGLVNNADRTVWIDELKFTYSGDSNLDGEFNSTDFVGVFQAGQYEDAIAQNSTWATGDWNGDGEFDSSDFVAAFQAGGYEIGPRQPVAAVPEPTSWTLLAVFALGMRRRRRG